MTVRTPSKNSLEFDSLVPASQTSNTPIAGHSVDTKGFLWLRTKLHLGLHSGDETIVLSLEHSNDDAATDPFVAVPSGPVYPTTGTYNTSGANGDKPKELMIFLQTMEMKRYVRP